MITRPLPILLLLGACAEGEPVDLVVRIAHVGAVYDALDAAAVDDGGATLRGGPSERLELAVVVDGVLVRTPPEGAPFVGGDLTELLEVDGGGAPALTASLAASGADGWELALIPVGEAVVGAGVAVASRAAGLLHRDDAPVDTLGEGAAALMTWLDPQVGLTVPLGGPAWAVGPEGSTLFTVGAAASPELEILAEDGASAPLAGALSTDPAWTHTGFAQSPEGTYEPGPVLPGAAYRLQVLARPGDRLHLAWMFAESNDAFFAFGAEGAPLLDEDGAVLEGPLTGLALWDAGTEVDQPLGTGPDQAPRQGAANTGEAQGGAVGPVDASLGWPRVEDVVQIELIDERWLAVD